MDFVIRSARIFDTNSSFHNSVQDILISNGRIKDIDKEIDFDGKEVKADSLIVSTGWCDMRSHYQDPGREHKEDLETGTAVAGAGGFTSVALLPNNDPVTDSKNAIAYFSRWNKHSAVQLHPIAAVSRNAEGKELTEMIDLHTAGAKAFGDGLRPIWHTDIMLKALQYVQKFNGLLINKPEDEMLTAFGHMNEGKQSTLMGLKGMPALSEEIMIRRDLNLLEYSGGRVHFTMISTKAGVELVREAKKKGLNVTCDVGVNYLLFAEEDLADYDTNLKVNPPYRTQEDRLALIEGVKDGTIDCIVSDHIPHDEESKKLEFDLAEFGSSNQQTFLPVLYKVFGDDMLEYIALFTEKPRKLLSLPSEPIEVGADASLSLFNFDDWTYNTSTNQSKSVASPFFNQNLKGKVIGIVNNGQLILN